jgi:polyisoprenyl-teichoic acid--peptidoglycan teichoic acid transferase
MVSDTKGRHPYSLTQLPRWFYGVVGLIILFLLAASSLWLHQTVRNMVATFEISEPEFGPVTDEATAGSIDADTGLAAPQVVDTGQPLISAEALKPWQGVEPVTLLLLGVDQRCDEGGPTHTDTLMVVTIDPVAQTVSMLSLPRDLWVKIPGFDVDRINQAHYFGEAFEYPGGGPALAVETVEAFIGLPIDYYVTINFDAFIRIVDQIGGIDIDVPESIIDPTYPDRCYGYDPFTIEAGQQHLDGETALKYARTRATFGGDVDRAARQQAVVMAVRERVLKLDMVPQLIRQAPSLWQALQDNVRTNLPLDKAVQLGLLVQEIPGDNIQTAVIDYEYVYTETTLDERQVLVPIRDKVRNLRDTMFVPNLAPPLAADDLIKQATDESARIALYNGTAVFGLASATQAYLEMFDLNITEIGNADAATYRTTRIIDYGSHPHTVRYLIQLMNIPPLNVSNGSQPDGDFDVLVIIGNDWRVPEP